MKEHELLKKIDDAIIRIVNTVKQGEKNTLDIKNMSKEDKGANVEVFSKIKDKMFNMTSWEHTGVSVPEHIIRFETNKSFPSSVLINSSFMCFVHGKLTEDDTVQRFEGNVYKDDKGYYINFRYDATILPIETHNYAEIFTGEGELVSNRLYFK